MTTRLLMLVAVLASASLAGCDGGGGGMNNNGGGGGGAARTVSTIVGQEINQNTANDAVPIQINDLPVSGEDTDETSSPDAVN